jgi:hypothetical protein
LCPVLFVVEFELREVAGRRREKVRLWGFIGIYCGGMCGKGLVYYYIFCR